MSQDRSGAHPTDKKLPLAVKFSFSSFSPYTACTIFPKMNQQNCRGSATYQASAYDHTTTPFFVLLRLTKFRGRE